MEKKYRIAYANLKIGRFFDMNCVDKVYRTIKKMEAAGEAQIFVDERKEPAKQPPYSSEDYEDAKAQGLDLDDWHDYVDYFELGEQEEEY